MEVALSQCWLMGRQEKTFEVHARYVYVKDDSDDISRGNE